MTLEQISEQQKRLDKQIMLSRKEIRSDRMDMSFGEIMNMYADDELVISPEFQRAFRWQEEAQTKFIESILLGIPIPPIFVAETSGNIWELVDGLQRLSTILSFFGVLKDDKKNGLILGEGSILTELKGMDIKTIPLNYKLLLKRAVCRVEVIRFDSEFDMRYELFNRLNTGGVKLSEQEIRNCIFRVYDNKFNDFVGEMANNPKYQELIIIRDEQKESMYYQELVLRYLTLKNKGTILEKNIQTHMDEYMLAVSKNEMQFEYEEEKKLFERVLSLVYSQGNGVFGLGTLYFSTSMYDAIMLNAAENIDFLETLTKEELTQRICQLREDGEFRQRTASNSKYRISSKVQSASKYLRAGE